MGSGTGSSPALIRAIISAAAPPRFLRGDDAVPAHRHPLRRLAVRAGLDDVGLPARGVDTNPEAGKFAVPEDRVLLDLQRLDRPPRDRLRPEPRHIRASPFRALRRLVFLAVRTKDVRADAAADLDRRGLLGVARQVRVARGRRHLAVAEQLADHRQTLTDRHRPRSI